MKKHRKKLWFYLLMPLLVLFSLLAVTNTVQAKELQNVITNIKMWDVDNGNEKQPNAQGVYELTTNDKYANYKYMVDFDLSKYNGQLNDGDSFTFTIPAPMTVKAETFDIKDNDTKVALASAKVVSNGDGKGGKVTITLKNLQEYLKKKGGTQIENIKGTFFTGFSVKEEKDETTVTYPSTETKNSISHKIKVRKPVAPDYSYEIGTTNFAKVGGIIEKDSWSSEILKKKGDYSHPFIVRVNDRQAKYDVIDVHDSISSDYAPSQFIPETLKVESGFYDKSYNLNDSKTMTKDVDYTIEWNESYTDFKIKIKNASARIASNGKPAAYRITYKTTAPADGTQIANKVEVSGDKKPLTTRTDKTDTEIVAVRNSQVTSGGTIQLETGYRITLYKVDEKTQNRLAGAKFKITPPAGATAQEEVVTTDDKGVAQSKIYSESDVKKGEFTVTEIEAPLGYELNPTPLKVTVGKAGVIKTINNKRAVTSVKVNKKWVGKTGSEVKVELQADGTKVSETTLNEANNWEYTFSNLEKYNKDNKLIKYTVKEVKVEEGYQSKVEGTATDGYTITNTYTPAAATKAKISGKKVLEGKALEARKYSFILKKDDGSIVQTVTNDANGNFAFDELAYNEDQVGTHKYTIEEVQGTEPGITYDTTIQTVEVTVKKVSATKLEATISKKASDLVFTNKYTPAKTQIPVKKVWDDANNQDGKRPKSITVNLLANGEKVDSKEVRAAADGTWSTVFTKLPKYKNGKEIKYSLTEEVVSEYTSEINGFNITNKYTPKMIDYQVTKTWNDNNNQDGKRPDYITVHLMKTVGGATTEVEKYNIKVAEADPANGNVWKHTFSNLPKYEAGQEIVYSVKEDAVAGYETSIKGQEITNTHTPETIVISGKKVWEDNNNQDGKRTRMVKVQILKGENGPVVDEIETSEEKGWAFESKPLPKYENGQEIKYEVKEVAVESYQSEVKSSGHNQYTITNKHTPEKIKLTGQKTWNDSDNQDGKRPTEIKVRLLADGKDTGKVATASEATDWKYSFEGLDRYKAGKEIVYSVEEVDVPKGYQSEANGMNLVNSHTPEVTSVSGQKTWEDENDKDGLRPKEIQVKLLANGKDTGKLATASEATGWKYSFEKLAKYEAGKAITYTVEEVAVPKGYTAKVYGMNITNSHTPEKPQTPPSTPENPKKVILPSTGSQESILAVLTGLVTLGGVAYLMKKKL
ncbi:Cna B-type domain-containing protein [Streptococcus intermedius]